MSGIQLEMELVRFQWRLFDIGLIAFTLATFIFTIIIYYAYTIFLDLYIIAIISTDIICVMVRWYGQRRDANKVKQGKYDMNKVPKNAKISMISLIIFASIMGYVAFSLNINVLDLFYYRINKDILAPNAGIYFFCLYFFVLANIGWLAELWDIIWLKNFFLRK